MANFSSSGFQKIPEIVKNIIIINVIVVFMQFVLYSRGINLDDYLALHYWQSPQFRWWQLVTHIFMHGDPKDLQGTFFHIAFNMFALWMFGAILENLWGPRRFLIFYLICGVGAALCHMSVLTYEFTTFNTAVQHFQTNPTFVNYAQIVRHRNLTQYVPVRDLFSHWNQYPDCGNCADLALEQLRSLYHVMVEDATMVGASGAVYGVLFAFGYLFPNAELMLLFPPIPIKAKWAVAIFALIELSLGVYNSSTDNIAHFAHLGGMLFAFILLKIWRKSIRNNFY